MTDGTEIEIEIEIGTETGIGTVKIDTAMTVGGTTAMTGGMIDVKTAGVHVLVNVGNATDNPQHLLVPLRRMTRHQPPRQWKMKNSRRNEQNWRLGRRSEKRKKL